MGWARLDDGFHDHPKVDGLSLAAVGLYTLSLTWAHRHRRKAAIPGHVPDSRVTRVAGARTKALASELVAAGLWETADIGGYLIHDFADYLPKERDPDELRASAKKGAASKWQRAKQDDAKQPGKQLGKDNGSLPAGSLANDASRASTRSAAPASAPAFPSRSSSSVGRDSLETLHEIDEPPPPNCDRHPDGTEAPCAACGRARTARADWDEHQAKLRRQDAADRKRGEEQARRAAIRSCELCDETGYRLPDAIAVCTHRPLNPGGRARAEAELDKPASGRTQP